MLYRNISLVACLLVFSPVLSLPGNASQIQQQTKNSQQLLLNQGLHLYRRARYTEAISLWQQIATKQADKTKAAQIQNLIAQAYLDRGEINQAQTAIAKASKNLKEIDRLTQAKILNTQGSIDHARGKYTEAANNWNLAKNLYESERDYQGIVGTTINQSLLQQKLGQYRQAKSTLTHLQPAISKAPAKLQALFSKNLGIAYATIGETKLAKDNLVQAQKIAQDPETKAAIAIDLGNLYSSINNPPEAIANYEAAYQTSVRPETKIIALVNTIEPLYELKQIDKAITNLKQAENLLTNYNSSELIINKIAKTLWLRQRIDKKNLVSQAEQIELEAIATSTASPRIKSYALGTLAAIAEQNNRLDTATELNQTAIEYALTIARPDIAYQWQHQLGRVHASQNQTDKAIASYQAAVDNLAEIRKNLIAYNPDAQYNFQENIEPIYRQLVSLLVTNPTQENLAQARNTLESLQIAELENYFRQACLQGKPEQIDKIDPTAATIYPILLPDRLATIVAIPGEDLNLHYHETPIDAAEIKTTIDKFKFHLNISGSSKIRQKQGQKIYNWLIAPHQEQLAAKNIKTLVFVLDKGLRDIPLATINKDDRYLIEDYAVALTPGLQLLASRPLKERNLEAVVGGLSENNQGFAALPAVQNEVEEIASTIESKTLLNQSFTNKNLQTTLSRTKDAPILHLATHGEFSSDPEKTFILTWNDKITVRKLENLLKVREGTPKLIPIELLVLSACNTAKGDDNAALGLAGVAIESGARSTIGTLWSVNDRSTSILIEELYKQIQSNPQNKAEILRQAQLKLIESKQFNHPYYWGAFTLVGNWI